MTNKFKGCECTPPLKSKFKINAGDSYEFDVFITSNEEPFDLTGCSVTFTAVDDLSSPEVVVTKSIGDGILVMNLIGGHVKVLLSPPDTLSMGPYGGLMYFDVKLTDINSTISTVATGRLVFIDDVN